MVVYPECHCSLWRKPNSSKVELSSTVARFDQKPVDQNPVIAWYNAQWMEVGAAHKKTSGMSLLTTDLKATLSDVNSHQTWIYHDISMWWFAKNRGQPPVLIPFGLGFSMKFSIQRSIGVPPFSELETSLGSCLHAAGLSVQMHPWVTWFFFDPFKTHRKISYKHVLSMSYAYDIILHMFWFSSDSWKDHILRKKKNRLWLP